MRSNVLTTINSVQRGLAITQADLERQAGKYAGRITNAPGQERQLVSISRQQEIKAGLYLMLLQSVKKTPSLWHLPPTTPAWWTKHWQTPSPYLPKER